MIERKYFEINEPLAKSSRAMWSFSDYTAGSATSKYKTVIDCVYEIVDKIQELKPERLPEALQLAEKFSKSYAQWIDKKHSIDMMCPSVMICGPANFPVKKKDRQIAAMDKHLKDLSFIDKYKDKLENILHSQEVIKSGDSEAIEKLQAKLTELEALQNTMKEVNAYYKKNGTLDGCELISQKSIDAIKNNMQRVPYINRPFESYALTNNNAKIKATKERLELLQKAKAEPIKEVEQSDICKVVENTEIMRIQLIFDGKPDEETRTILKSNGFKWAPSQGAWQRQLTDNARYSTKKALEQLKAI